MPFPLIILSVLFTFFASADELPWIGVSLEFAKSEVRKNANLPDGVGFEVTRVMKESPLAKVGGQVGDVWWKFDGQILIAKRQMLVLLRTKSSGDSVGIEYFRNGKLESLTLTLESQQRQEGYLISMKTPDSSASRVLAKREQIARVTIGDQNLTLERENEQWRFEIHENGTAVLSSLVSEHDLSEKVPAKWHGAFIILKMTLEKQSSGVGAPIKPRVRYVPRKQASGE